MITKSLLSLLLVGVVGAFGVGCGSDPCEEASDICGGGEDGGENAGEDVEVECEGQVKCAAECIVEADSCDVAQESLTNCLTNCAGETEAAE